LQKDIQNLQESLNDSNQNIEKLNSQKDQQAKEIVEYKTKISELQDSITELTRPPTPPPVIEKKN